MHKYTDLQDAGFEEVIEKPKSVKPKPVKKEIAPYVVVDNTEVIREMQHSNEMMKNAITNLVGKMKVKPVSMELDIVRDDAGFMKKVNVNFKY